MLARIIDVQVLQVRLLIDDYKVDIVMTAQAMISDRKQAISIGRQVYPGDDSLLGKIAIYKARPLMTKAIVIVAPTSLCQQIVKRWDRFAPWELGRTGLKPLGMLRGHRIDNHRKGFIACEHAIPSGKRVALQPSLVIVLR